MDVMDQRPAVRLDAMKSSDDHVESHERRLENEIDQLCLDIRRIGPTFPDPEPHVLFGELFDDEQVEQYYEALVGTLKSAKKRGLITFKGQMLLKGAHDNVIISLAGAEPKNEVVSKKSALVAPKPLPTNNIKPLAPKNPNISRFNSKTRAPSQFSYLNTASTFPSKSYLPSSSYSRSYPRSSSFKYTSSKPYSQATAKQPSTIKSSQSTSSVTSSSSKDKSASPSLATPSFSRPATKLVRAETCPSSFARTELSDRIEKEIPQLLKDIRRIGTFGEPVVKFGELFDDEEVEQYYEALVGTLKSAKKRGYISFKGQMLLKGMHDNVEISIKE